ncbi:restriction endonuclease subunit S [Aeromonas veronii]|uniref:restriction endonuclease subunit S n=1 Tax=Aeromonas veronii TaxID=654 RepID=UPI001E65609C|nr:restriction endonuclease subunit S [Aeromonas veronii]MCD6617044.1 restriction endonuclease subunit S [Aeromonas veronii]
MVKLGDLCKTGAGGTPLKSKKEFYEGGTIPWLLSGEVAQGEILKATSFITQEGLENSSAKLFPPNTVLVAMYGATAGQVGVLRIEASTNQAVCGIFPNEYFVPEFLFYLLLSRKDELIAQAAGNAQPNISQQKIRDTFVPVVPLPEQQRIMAILDEAFEAIAAARANAEQNRQNARALFESYLQSVFSQRGKGWVDTTISAATGGVFTGPFGSLLHKSDYIEHGIPLVNPAHITSVGIEPDLRKTVSEETAQRLSNYIMRAGDIVIGRRGEMGRCAIVTDVEDGWLCGTGSFVIKPSERCDARYLVRLLRSESCKTQLENIAGGAVMPNLSNTDLSNFPIILPPIDIQLSVLRKIDLMAEKIQCLESLYQRKIAALDELKQSLLQQAFSGQL